MPRSGKHARGNHEPGKEAPSLYPPSFSLLAGYIGVRVLAPWATRTSTNPTHPRTRHRGTPEEATHGETPTCLGLQSSRFVTDKVRWSARSLTCNASQSFVTTADTRCHNPCIAHPESGKDMGTYVCIYVYGYTHTHTHTHRYTHTHTYTHTDGRAIWDGPTHSRWSYELGKREGGLRGG